MAAVKTLADVVDERKREDEEDLENGFNHIMIKNVGGSHLSRLRSMVLDHQSIESLKGGTILAETCPHLCDLDVSHNQLTSWSEVFQLMHQLPALRQLSVAFNPFVNQLPSTAMTEGGQPQDEAVAALVASLPPSKKHAGLKTLILNGTFCPWPIVVRFLEQCEMVEELHLSCNDYDDVGVPRDCHRNLKRLFFNNNAVSSWERLEQLGVAFPQLYMMVIRANPLNVPHPSDDDTTAKPEKASENVEAGGEEKEYEAPASLPLTVVSNMVLSETKISSMDELCGLVQRCPGLRELRVQSIPLVNDWPEAMHRHGIIACMPQLTCLNGSEINSEEREKAERAFVRRYGQDEGVTGKVREIVQGLTEKHGSLTPLADIHLGPPKGKVALLLRWEEDYGSGEPRPAVTLNVPWATSFVSFKVKVARCLSIDPRKAQKLEFYRKDPDGYSVGLCEFTVPRDRALHNGALSSGEELWVRVLR